MIYFYGTDKNKHQYNRYNIKNIFVYYRNMEIRMPRRVTKKKKIRIKEKRITMSKRLMIGGVANRPLSEENQTFLDENKKNIRQYINDLIVYKNTTPFSNVAVKELNNRITILLKKKKNIDNNKKKDPI